MIKKSFKNNCKPLAVINSFQGREYYATEISADTISLVNRSLTVKDCYGTGLAPYLNNDKNNKENINARKENILCTLTRIDNHYNIVSNKKELDINGQKLKKGQMQILMSQDKISLVGDKKKHFYFKYLSNQVNTGFPENIMAGFHTSSAIGNGACGQAFLVYDIKTGQKYAVKKSKKEHNESIENFSLEAQIHMNLNHPNIVKLLKVYNSPEASFLFTEYLNSGDILSIIKYKDYKRLEEKEAKMCIFQVVQGLKYLHERNICHLDIKCDNIFVEQKNDKYICKIGDFGLAAYNENLKESIGTLAYSPPELLVKKSNDVYDGKCCDIWSLGVTMFSMLSGHFPFNKNDKFKLRLLIKDAVITFDREVWNYITNDAKHLIKSMIIKDPKCRLKIHEIENHPWLIDFDIAKEYELASSRGSLNKKDKSPIVLKRKNTDFGNYDGPSSSTRSKKAKVA